MTEQEDPSRERLKNHFAQRVTHQARQLLELWQRLQANEWSPASLTELARAINVALQDMAANQSRLNSRSSLNSTA